jgi:hypothetical protein
MDYLPYIIAGGATFVFVGVMWAVTDSGPSDTIDLTKPTTHVVITGGSRLLLIFTLDVFFLI